MNTSTPPFDDEKVRQAFRLMIDREQMLASSVAGLGVVANDVYGLHDPCYDTSLTREQDIEQAQSLLKQAGQEGLTVELVTAPIAAGAVEAAQVLAQQAKEAGGHGEPAQDERERLLHQLHEVAVRAGLHRL